MITRYGIAHGNKHVSRVDAANDGHSGYTIYSRLVEMAGTMVNPPRETYYTFDVSRGTLCDRFGRTWHPINPDYDPGPPPPPKPPKEKKDQKTEGGIEKPPVVTKQPQQPRGHHYHHQHEGLSHKPHWLSDAVPGSSSEQADRRQRHPGDRTETSGGRGRGYTGPGPIRQSRGRGRGRGGGNRIGTFDKCVHRVLRTLRRL